MDELSRTRRRVTRWTLLLGGAGSALALLAGWKAAAGVAVSAAMCLAGFYMIARWSAGPLSRNGGIANYCLRYVFYGAVLFVSLRAGLPVFSLPAGIFLQKGAVVLASCNGKEAEYGTNQRS